MIAATPHGVVVLSQFRNVAVIGLEGLGRHGSWRLLHDRSLSSVARDESRMARDESRMAGGEPHMTGDYCPPEESIHRCVRTHSHLYSYIYGLVALLDNIQSSFSKYYYLNRGLYDRRGSWKVFMIDEVRGKSLRSRRFSEVFVVDEVLGRSWKDRKKKK